MFFAPTSKEKDEDVVRVTQSGNLVLRHVEALEAERSSICDDDQERKKFEERGLRHVHERDSKR